MRGIVRAHGGVLQTHEVPGMSGSAYVLEVPIGGGAGAVVADETATGAELALPGQSPAGDDNHNNNGNGATGVNARRRARRSSVDAFLESDVPEGAAEVDADGDGDSDGESGDGLVPVGSGGPGDSASEAVAPTGRRRRRAAEEAVAAPGAAPQPAPAPSTEGDSGTGRRRGRPAPSTRVHRATQPAGTVSPRVPSSWRASTA